MVRSVALKYGVFLLRSVRSDLISTLRNISTLILFLRDIVTCMLCCSALHGSVSVPFFCSALPLSVMGCVGLLCFVLFFYYICCFCFGVLCLYSCWFALFSFIVRCLVSFCFVWLFALGLIEFAASCVVLCGIAPFRFVLFRFVLLPVHLHLAVC